MADFRDVVSVLPVARLIKASRNLCGFAKSYSTVRNQGVFPGFLIIIVVEPAHHKAAGCELVGAKIGCNFQFISLSHSAYITFRIIMSLRKPCHMPFPKLIPPFTLTALFFLWLVCLLGFWLKMRRLSEYRFRIASVSNMRLLTSPCFMRKRVEKSSVAYAAI